MYLILQENNSVIFPASWEQLRQRNPNVSFGVTDSFSSYSDAELELFGAYPVQLGTAPSYDPVSQRLSYSSPSYDGSIWSVEFEIIDFDPVVQAPSVDFAGFQLAALSSPEFQALIGAALPLTPLAALSLPTLLQQVADGKPANNLILAFSQIIQATNPTQEVLESFIGIAETYYLPEPLIDQLLRVHLP